MPAVAGVIPHALSRLTRLRPGAATGRDFSHDAIPRAPRGEAPGSDGRGRRRTLTLERPWTLDTPIAPLLSLVCAQLRTPHSSVTYAFL